MAGKRIDIGPTGATVAANITRIREDGGVTWTQLAARVAASGRSISPIALRRIEDCERRVDVDDLVAIARALSVSPITLLMPPTDDPTEHLETTVSPAVPAARFWGWLSTEKPYYTDDLTEQWRLQWFGRPVWARPEHFSFTEGAPPPAPGWVESSETHGNH